MVISTFLVLQFSNNYVGSLASGRCSSGPTTGQTVLKVIGSNFGCPKLPIRYAKEDNLHGYFRAYLTHMVNCQVHLAGVNHSSLLCTTSEGVGENLYMEVNVSGRTTPRKENAFSYLRPSISIFHAIQAQHLH